MKKNSKLKGFSIHIMPYSEIKNLDGDERIRKILSIVLGNYILIIQGRLKPEEEGRLIEDTMAMVDHIKTFKGIELAVVDSYRDDSSFFLKMRRGIARGLTGESNSLTVIGPASIVKEIKKDPSKIEVFFG